MAAAANERRMIFFTGLPAAGKSLFLQQQTLLAADAGKRIHFLRWDIALAAFQEKSLLTKYPDTDGVTHPLIRKAAGLWSRRAIARWQLEFPGSEELLIGEFPISGNRFVELVQVMDDDVEPVLAGDSAVFFVPVPTNEVRRKLVAKRQASISNPQHSDETRDAPMSTLENVWRETRYLAGDLGLISVTEDSSSVDYDQTIYACFFQHLLQHRNNRVLAVEEMYAGVGSAHDFNVECCEIIASASEANECVSVLESTWNREEINRSVESWYNV
ncbi:MAG: hypothetical protein ACI8P9_002659 [Parasphingorhabdus sp.]|jgi:hypothetical protein